MMDKIKIFIALTAAGGLLAGCDSSADYSRGVGLYPGNPAENFAPELVTDNTYRNVAALKSAYHSSSYDYNLTAQLVTDGIIATGAPASIRVFTTNGDLQKNEREWLFDGKSDSKYIIPGSDIFLQLDLSNMSVPASRIVLRGSVIADEKKAGGYEITLYGSHDGISWDVLKRDKGSGYAGTENPFRRGFFSFPPPPANAPKPEPAPSPVIFSYDYKPAPADAPTFGFGGDRFMMARTLNIETALSEPTAYAHYKFAFRMPAATEWAFTEWEFYRGSEVLSALPSYHFTSAWQSATAGEEWVYLDFGAPASYDKINLHWINKAVAGKVQASDDAKSWTDIAELPGSAGKEDAILLDKPVKSRYLRLLLAEAENRQPYILSEVQVYGKGGLTPRAHAALPATASYYNLSGGGWKLQRASLVDASGETLSKPGYEDEEWVMATVPGTVLSSFINIGAVPDPNYADNQLQASESYFLSDFWYRNEFTVSKSVDYAFLNFDGINWKADVFLNGQPVGHIDGGFMRGRFDVSKTLVKGKNAIAVRIIKNAHPGAIKEQTAWSTDRNGGMPGADNPTFHATIGWDWIPTIRGRDIGIWNDVFLTFSGAVTMEDPFVRTQLPLPDTTYANVIVEVTLKNHSAEAVNGTLKGSYGEAAFEQPVSLEANEEKVVQLDAFTTPALHLKNPKLWWPKGYGAPHLYDVALSFDVNGKVSDRTTFKSGVRQMTFDENTYTPSGGMSFGFFGAAEQRRLSLYVNGRRLVGFGGNWGFGESNLSYRGREYDIAVKYHADMNFTMIRNWVGQIGDEEFYEACDRHGIMVWQDFWLANPLDGPDPYYVDMFNATARDYVKRIRNHPSIGIYVGRNEGNPPDEIDGYLRAMIPQEHPGIHYISNSAMGVVSGGGPYRALPPKDYFQSYGHDKLHSERGMPNVMNYESLVQAFGEDGVTPVSTMETPNSLYGLHDYTLGGSPDVSSAQAANSFNEIITLAFGQPKDAKQFAEWAQWINYNGYRAIFEGRSEHRRGMLLWMSHPAWPSMVWQTYDYYFDPTGAYFGCKKASEPIHIQWNPLREDVEVVNYHAFDKQGLTAKAQLINQDGTVQWEKEAPLNIKEDATVACFPLEFPVTLSNTYFIRLSLLENGKEISGNFYWRGKEEGNYQSLHQVPKVQLDEKTTASKTGKTWTVKTTLTNSTTAPALMVRLQVKGSKTGERILPVFYSDNYLFLMPGEEKTITMELANSDTRGEKPVVEVTGFNL
ncbi:MAG: discoidin domain-containing protein [Prevotellaceae bacterium]|nr:discoidin domain-containing protein [Prevotellaceae bacterium]